MEALLESIPQKESGELKQIVELYDKKNYKKAEKRVEKLIEKNPKVLEFQSLKALIMHFIPEQTSSALPLAKSILVKNLKSAFAWQVCGIINRHVHNYKEACKCYEQALKMSPNSVGLLRDASNLYIHSRDLIANREIRRRILVGKPGILQNWAAYAVALHMLNQNPEAVIVVDDLLDILMKDDNTKGVEIHNLLCYKAFLYRDAENWVDLRAFLKKDGLKIKDELFRVRYIYEAALNLKETDIALTILKNLLKLNPDDRDYILSFAQLSEKPLLENLEILTKEFKSSTAPLIFLEKLITNDADWEQLFIKQLNNAAKKFVPSFSRVITTLCKLPNRSNKIDEILLKTLESLQKNSKLIDSDTLEDPTAELFALSLLAQRKYDLKKYEEAAKYAEEAKNHTPSYEDTYIILSKSYLKLGEIEKACEIAKYGQTLNTADRGLATNVVMILFKALRIEEADALFKKFMKGDSDSVEKNVHDLQMIKFQRARGKALINAGRWREGLRQLSFLLEAQWTFNEDQYDFYSYALRKFNCLPLYEMLQLNDKKMAQNLTMTKGVIEYLNVLLSYSRFVEKDNFEKKPSIMFSADADKANDLYGAKFDKNYINEQIVMAFDFLKKVKSSEISQKTMTKIQAAVFDYSIQKDAIFPAARSLKYILTKGIADSKTAKRISEFKSKASKAEGIVAELLKDFLNSLPNLEKELEKKTAAFNEYEKLKAKDNLNDLKAKIEKDFTDFSNKSWKEKKLIHSYTKSDIDDPELLKNIALKMYPAPVVQEPPKDTKKPSEESIKETDSSPQAKEVKEPK